MENVTLCILACGKNVEPYLQSTLSNIATIETWVKTSKTIIFENDSVDNTNQILTAWAKNSPDRSILTEKGLDNRIPLREKRLAYIRNVLIQQIPVGFTYFMMVDIDDVFVTPVQKESFESCFKLRNWDIVTANGYHSYYDIYALRIPGVLWYNCISKYFELVSYNQYTHEEALEESTEKFKRLMVKIKNPVYVNSAFNTAILGKVDSVKSCCKYSEIVESTKSDICCEHVSFHTCIRSHGGKILFNPNFKL